MLTAPIPLKLYDDPVAAYNELAATVAPGDRYCQDFDYSVAELPHCTTARYLEASFPANPITDRDDDLDSWHIRQGSLAACGTFANIACYASIPADSPWALEKGLYPLTPSPIGLYLVRITDPSDPARLKWMAIDSKVPCEAKEGSKSTCIQVRDGDPLAPALLTKAAATARGGSFDEISNSKQLGLKFTWFPQKTERCTTFAEFKAALAKGGMYTFSMRQQYDSAGVAVKPAGVVYAHAFGVVDAIDGADYQLVRIENPWGGGSDFLSEYSDGSEFWATHPELKRKADDSLASGGNFWIDWATFQKLCRHDAYDVAVPVS